MIERQTYAAGHARASLVCSQDRVSHLVGEPPKDLIGCRLLRSPSRRHDEQVVSTGIEPIADGEIAVKRLSCGHVDRQESAFAELALTNNETVIAEIIALER
jgi:hypothetical protein